MLCAAVARRYHERETRRPRIMELQLKGRNALVTGASMGIGRAIARGLAAEGVSASAMLELLFAQV